MTAPQDREEGFRVTDRRRRADLETAAGPQPGAPAEREGPSGPGVRPGPVPEGSPATPDEVERSLVGLFMMLASSALLALGEAPDPETGLRQTDLPGAADVIDTLLLLREKTEGHRSAEETQVLDELLYDLQVRYVRATTRSG